MENEPVVPRSTHSRRTLMGWLIAGINLLVAGAVIGPVVGFIGSPLKRRSKAKWVAILNESELPEGIVREVKFTVQVQDGYHVVDRAYTLYLRRKDGEVVAIDPSCTHLGCRVRYQDDKQRFFCPCHGGVFDQEGNVVSGPPPKPLERHSVKVEAGKIWVSRMV